MKKFKISLELPWPDKVLNPNDHHTHWSKKAEAAREAKQYAYYYTLSQGHGQALEGRKKYKLKQSITFHPPDRRTRDDDNFLKALKPTRDGIFMALASDDKYIRKTVIEWGEVVPYGKVTIILEEML